MGLTPRDAALVAAGAAGAVALPAVARACRRAWAAAPSWRRGPARAASASPPTVLLLGHAARIEAGIRATLTSEWRVEAVADSAAALREAVARSGGRVAAVVAAPPCAAYFREAMAALPGLALLQVLSAGHEFVAMDAVPRGATVCNSSSMDVPIAEYCVAAVLEARVRCRVLHDAMRASRTWRPPFYEAAPAASACVHGELEGAAVALVGFGAIGRAVAARLGPFGCRLDVARSKTTAAELDAMLQRADVVVLACACNAATAGLVDARRLALMKPTATLVNVSRGAVVDEGALFDALAAKRLAHAVLDVWWRYPAGPAEARAGAAPGARPWHDLGRDVLTMTPHASGWSDKQDARKCAQIADNLDRLAAGRGLARVVGP